MTNPWPSWFAIFGAACLSTFAAVPVIGNALPGHYGQFIPMPVRDEFVLRHPVADTPKPCIAFLGDSRTAFNISSAIVDRSLPGGCRSQNYGFPALAPRKIIHLASEISVSNAIVVSLSETMVASKPDTGLVTRILETSWIRWLYLGHQRLLNLFRASHGQEALDSGWRWMSAEKRWRYIGLEQRSMVSLPTYEQEASAMAASYFQTRPPVDEHHLRWFLSALSSRAPRVIVIIPPSEAKFQLLANRYQGGMQPIWDAIKGVATTSGADIIDCSRSCVDPSGFADPVHLNEKGLEQYSRRLAQELDSLLTAATRP
jgi:hypothetical protein